MIDLFSDPLILGLVLLGTILGITVASCSRATSTLREVERALSDPWLLLARFRQRQRM